MLWVGKARYESYGIKSAQQEPPPAELNNLSAAAAALGNGTQGLRTYAEVVDAQLEKMAHPRRPFGPAGQSATGTSFTSAYTDQFSDQMSLPGSTVTRNGPGGYGAGHEHGAPLKRSESSKLSFQARLKDREGRVSRMSANSRYVPSSLSEVQNASEVKST
jgi:hypothetical protein